MTDNEMPELKPCPFCGGRAKIMPIMAGGNFNNVECQNYKGCGVRVIHKTLWNTRADLHKAALEHIADIEFMGQKFVVRRENHRAFQAIFNTLIGGE